MVRSCRVALLLVSGALCILCLYPLVPDRWRLALKRRWSAVVLGVLGIVVDADVERVPTGSLLVANHISWTDIFLINAVLPAAFVSKEEVRRWPVIGWLAACNDTVFLRRGSRGHARLINQEIGGLLASGKRVAVFPEGTTTDGTHVQHFHAALIQPALIANRPVVPLAISYWEEDGTRSLAPRYDGDISLGQCMRTLLSRRRIVARVVAAPPIGLDGEDRREVAAEARQAIMCYAGLLPPETTAGLPVATPKALLPTDNRNPGPEDRVAA